MDQIVCTVIGIDNDFGDDGLVEFYISGETNHLIPDIIMSFVEGRS